MNCQNNNNDEGSCITNILQVINVLQNKSEKIDDLPQTCDRPFLGCTQSTNCFVYNTRPVTLYNSSNLTFTFPYTLNGRAGTSDVLRVENVNNTCATFRVLAPSLDANALFPYVATDSFVTVNTSCVCALRCLPDTFVDCI